MVMQYSKIWPAVAQLYNMQIYIAVGVVDSVVLNPKYPDMFFDEYPEFQQYKNASAGSEYQL